MAFGGLPTSLVVYIIQDAGNSGSLGTCIFQSTQRWSDSWLVLLPQGGTGSSVTDRTARRVFPWQQDTEVTM